MDEVLLGRDEHRMQPRRRHARPRFAAAGAEKWGETMCSRLRLVPVMLYTTRAVISATVIVSQSDRSL